MIGIDYRQTVTRLERLSDDRCWRVWFTANVDFTKGNYLLLHDDGSVEHVHVGQNVERVLEVKPKDTGDNNGC